MADNPDQVVAFSSRGPASDGRVKPDVVAPGTFILSTRSTMIAPNNTAWAAYPPSKLYFYMGGTSMATPLTAGAVAIIREFLRTKKGVNDPSAALLKATLIAGATRLTGYGSPGVVLDNEQGFGRVNLDAVLAPSSPAASAFIEISPGLSTGEVYTTNLDIKTADVPLRVVLAYSDYPGPALVNNLNLILIAPDGRRYTGNQASGATLTLDATNNIEVGHVPNPQPGGWTLQVVGSNIPNGPQDFALVYLAHLGVAAEEDVVHAEALPDLAIPDDNVNGVNSIITLSEAGIISHVKVGVNISHTYIGDLRVVLAAPGQAEVVLHDRTGASTHDLVKTYDVQTTPNLSQLKGKSITGDWKLTVSDLAGIDTGKLLSWNLEIQLVSTRQVELESIPSLAVPDNDPAGITDTIQMVESGDIQGINVWLDITHTWIGDLRVILIAPSGDEISLHDRSGGSQDNLIRTYADETLPALTALVGKPVQGTWTLRVMDLAGRDVGKLNRWGLRLWL
jgi:subtilisin-like proprotein convertase family protein